MASFSRTGQSMERARGRNIEDEDEFEDEYDYGNNGEQRERSARKRFRRSTRRPVAPAPSDTHECSLTGPTRSFETRLIVVRTRPLVLSSSNRPRPRTRPRTRSLGWLRFRGQGNRYKEDAEENSTRTSSSSSTIMGTMASNERCPLESGFADRRVDESLRHPAIRTSIP